MVLHESSLDWPNEVQSFYWRSRSNERARCVALRAPRQEDGHNCRRERLR